MVAAVWQLTRTKRRALLACRRTVALPPCGPRADAACIRFGLRQARRCVVSCWPLMLLMLVLPANVAWLAGLAIVMYAEERTRLGRQLVRPLAALFTVAATAVALLG
jgi:predicted metal-binding membrane protein